MPFQLIYSSAATVPMTPQALKEILDDARSGNTKRDVTGLLVYVDDVFLQILEGEREVVIGLMSQIARDRRHYSVKVFREAEVAERTFASWRMAYVTPRADELAAWAGLAGATTMADVLASLEGDPERIPRVVLRLLELLGES